MKKPEALRLADELESTWCDESCVLENKAAAELRRLHHQNKELLTALKSLMPYVENLEDEGPLYEGWKSEKLVNEINFALNAIAKTEGEK